MTIAQMFVRMTRHLSQKVPSSMSDENKQWLVDAANLALTQFTQKLPPTRRREPRVEYLAAAVTKNITATQNSQTIAFDTPWADVGDHLGRTVVVGGDSARYNRLQSATSLLHFYEGPTGATTLEVHSDAFLVGQYEDGIEGELILQDGSYATPLTPGMPAGIAMRYANRMIGVTGGDAEANARYFTRGRPTHWWIEPLNGISGGSDPKFLVRLWPQPDKAYQVSFGMKLWPTALTSADISSTTVLPLTVAEESIFLSLCFLGLFGCPLWIGTNNKDDVQQEAARAFGLLGDEDSDKGSNQPSYVRTKPGY